MAKFTSKALKIVKDYFDEGKFIIQEGRIYKKYANYYSITVDGKGYSIMTKKIIKFLEDGIWISRSRKVTSKVLSTIKEKYDNKEIIIRNNCIYKKYGGKHQRGYIHFWSTIEGIKYRTFAHKIIYFLHYGIWDDVNVINHLDGNKENNRIENLELISQFENVLYSLRNDEIIFYIDFIDDVTRAKYRLDGTLWKIFKEEAYSNARRNVLNSYPHDILDYEAWRNCNTFEEYEEYINKNRK